MVKPKKGLHQHAEAMAAQKLALSTALLRMHALSLLSLFAAQAMNENPNNTLAVQQASDSNVLSVDTRVTRLEEQQYSVSLEQTADSLMIGHDLHNSSNLSNVNAEVCQSSPSPDQWHGQCNAR